MSEFDPTQRPLTKFRVDYLRLIWLSILFLILPVLFIVSGAVSFDHDLILILPFVAVPLGISLYRVILLLANMDLEILVFKDGFTYSKRGETRSIAWKQIDKVLTTRFELHSLIYIKYVKVKIVDTSGAELILDRTIQKIDQLEVIIQEQVAAAKFPEALTALEQGKPLEFGSITVTRDAIKNEHDTIRWNEFGDIQFWQGSMRLWKKGQPAISIMAGISAIPNFVLLVSLIRHLSTTVQTSPAPAQNVKNDANLSNGQDVPPKSKTGSRLRPGGNTDARLSGLFALLLGLGAGYWQIVLPIIKALQQAPRISYSTELVLVALLAIYMGLFLLIFGAAGLGFLSKPSSKLGLALFFIGLVVFVGGGSLGLNYIMKSLGYY